MSAPRALPRSWAAGPLAVLLLLSLLPACGPSDAAGDGEQSGAQTRAALTLRPGDTLLEHLDRVAAHVGAAGGVPTELAPAVAKLLSEPPEDIAPARWQALDEAPGGWSRFAVQPRLRLDLALGRVWLQHDGRRAQPRTNEPGRNQDATRVTVFEDGEGRARFSWDGETGQLMAVAAARPAAVRIGYDIDPVTAVGRLASVLGGRTTSSALSLAARVVSGRESRHRARRSRSD